MPVVRQQILRTRKRARRQRWKRIIREFGHLSDEEIDQIWEDHHAAVRRREKRAANALRGEERRECLTEILSNAIVDLARDYTRDYWWSGRLRHEKACRRVAADPPAEAKRLLKRRRVSWKTVRRYTAGLRGLRREDFDRDQARLTAARSSILNYLRQADG